MPALHETLTSKCTNNQQKQALVGDLFHWNTQVAAGIHKSTTTKNQHSQNLIGDFCNWLIPNYHNTVLTPKCQCHKTE